jgi:ATP-binding cassette subfamily F protein uup
MVAQRGVGVAAKPVAKPDVSKPARAKTAEPAPKRRLSFNEKHALETLPARIAKLEAEIAKLGKVIADPTLYARGRAAFDTASGALATAQAELAAAEDEWLRLEELRAAVETR